MIPAHLVLATSNAGKVREFGPLLVEWGQVRVDSLADHGAIELPEEDGATYVANAELKARAVASAVGLPALADDSGLEVDALDGAPGLYSARYAPTDAERIDRLLAALSATPAPRRTARFRCGVALVWPNGTAVTADGVCEGRILLARTGAGGFGYDPIFWSAALGQPLGAVTMAEKQRVSHRTVAVRALGARLAALPVKE